MAPKKTAPKVPTKAPVWKAPKPEDPPPVVVGAPVTEVPPAPVVAPQPPVLVEPRVEPPIPTKPKRGLTPEEEIVQLEKDKASIEARLWELYHPIIPFPKMVNGRTFSTREELDAAGPEFREKK